MSVTSSSSTYSQMLAGVVVICFSDVGEGFVAVFSDVSGDALSSSSSSTSMKSSPLSSQTSVMSLSSSSSPSSSFGVDVRTGAEFFVEM